MKRNISFTVLALVLGLANVAQAQMKIPAGKTRLEAVQAVAQAYGLSGVNRIGVELAEPLEQVVEYKEGMKLHDLLNAVLGPEYLFRVDEEFVLQVAPKGYDWDRGNAARQEQERFNSLTPTAAYGSNVGLLNIGLAATQPVYHQQMHATVPQPPVYPVSTYGGYPYGVTGVIGGYGGYGGYGFYGPDYDRCVNNPQHRDCRYGLLKIDGGSVGILQTLVRSSYSGEIFLQKVAIYVDGGYYGVASKHNNVFNDGIDIPVGTHTVQMVFVDEDMILFENKVPIYSRWDTRGNPRIVRVDANHFRNAPFRGRIARTPNEQLPARPAEEVLQRP